MGEKCWLTHYDAGVPHTLEPYPHRTLLDYIAETAQQRPEHPAMFFAGKRLTYGELARLSDVFAAALVDLGVKKGDRLALLLPNCPQFIIAEVGAWKVGAIVTPLSPLYSERELAGLLKAWGAETLVVLTPWYTRIKRIQPHTALKRVIATNIKEYLPPLQRLLFTLLKERKEGHRVRLHADDFRLSDLFKHYAQAPRPNTPAAPADAAVILMSGGTTGPPKGALARHRSLVASGLQSHAWLQPVWEDGRDIIMLPVPLSHAYGFIGGQSVAFVGHNPLVLIPNPRDITGIIRTIAHVRPTFLIAVPTLFNALLHHPDVRAGKVDLRCIKLCFSGAAPLPADTKQQFEVLTGAHILEGYSLTEAMLASTCNPVQGRNKLGSVGMPLPDVELRIVDVKSGEQGLTPGEVGEIIMRAPQLMTCYWENATETADALRAHGAGGPWLHTGDLGYMDDDGYVFLVERKKDLIKTSGYQVWPREVEEVIASHPAVAEVGVAGVPDPLKGEVVKAWVVLRPGMSALADEIRRHCQAMLAPYKVPAQVEFRHELPKTMIGKVRRRMLIEDYTSQQG
ncbi:MAG TPA: long-chain fatty acid--CoA ligase [Candidatus Tectomicrobia bacterium]|nr:long-chain fatty acid--CoA ligase [Candidatus Tectomicrobia bacterium]